MGRRPSMTAAENEVHVWTILMDLSPSPVERAECVLSPDEIARGRRFLREVDRRRFPVKRSVLREILAGYLGRDARGIEFTYSAEGKPSVADQPPETRLEFNLSDSDGVALVAIVPSRRVGIDVERIRPKLARQATELRVLSSVEVRALAAVPAAEKISAFFNAWTRKEAYLKARGCGLSLPPNSVEVAFGPSEEPALLRVGGEAEEAARWTLWTLAPCEGYVGAVVVEGGQCALKHFTWSHPI